MIPSTITIENQALIASLNQWWALAGVDHAILEQPRSWLARGSTYTTPARPSSAQEAAAEPANAPPVASPEPAPIETPPPVVMPDDLEGFLDWLSNDADQPESRFSPTLVMPHILAYADIMVVTEMPTAADMIAGRLFSGPERTLLTGILRAIGQDIDAVAIASLLLARPSGGIIEYSLAELATARLRHLIGLANARTIICFGDGTNRALQQMSGSAPETSSPGINHPTGNIPAMLLPAPFVLLKHAERKAAAWVELRKLAARR